MGKKGKNVPQTQFLKLKKKYPHCSPAELRAKYWESFNSNESQPSISRNHFTLSKNLLPSKPEQQTVSDLAPNSNIYSPNLEPISPSISEHEDSDSVRVKETSELVPSTSEPVSNISKLVQGTSEMSKGIPEPVPGIPEPIPEPKYP